MPDCSSFPRPSKTNSYLGKSEPFDDIILWEKAGAGHPVNTFLARFRLQTKACGLALSLHRLKRTSFEHVQACCDENNHEATGTNRRMAYRTSHQREEINLAVSRLSQFAARFDCIGGCRTREPTEMSHIVLQLSLVTIASICTRETASSDVEIGAARYARKFIDKKRHVRIQVSIRLDVYRVYSLNA